VEKRELKDLIIAWFVIGLAFALMLSRLNLRAIAMGYPINFNDFFISLPVSLIVVGAGFIFHELAHRTVARKFGYYAGFRAWPNLLLLAVGMALFLGFVFAAPGAVYVGEKRKRKKETVEWSEGYFEEDYSNLNREMGIISAAGPLTNIIVAIGFLGIGIVINFSAPLLLGEGMIASMIIGYGITINLFLALFNLIPFGPFDGAKVMKWNPGVWGIMFIPLVLWFLGGGF